MFYKKVVIFLDKITTFLLFFGLGCFLKNEGV